MPIKPALNSVKQIAVPARSTILSDTGIGNEEEKKREGSRGDDWRRDDKERKRGEAEMEGEGWVSLILLFVSTD